MISKELLSEVLGFSIYHFWLDGDYIVWREDGMSEINIYELVHKCKEWAFWKDYRILVKMTIPDIYRSEHKINYKYEIYHTDGTLEDECSWFDSEPEAIFKACQWILDKKGE